MSTLVVEVCQVSAVERHPHADRLGVATVKGWRTVIGFDPATQTFEFTPGEKCIYFPPDAVLPPALANSPYKVCRNKSCKASNKIPPQLAPDQRPTGDRCALCGSPLEWKDGTPGRTGAMAFCGELPKDDKGHRPPGGRVRAARLRGLQSFGFIMKIDPAQGDDPDWPVGTDLREYFGVTKWEPPIESADGETEPPHPAFHTYTDIEHLANFPGVLAAGEEVVFTEKIHGKNTRVGLILVKDESTGQAAWEWMAGSHAQRRKELFASVSRFDADELVEQLVLSDPNVTRCQVFQYDGGRSWRVVELSSTEGRRFFRAEEVFKQGDGAYAPRYKRSEFWEPLTDNVKALLEHVRDVYPWPEPKTGIVLFGELYGTLDMKYGLKNARGFRAFDLTINGRYLNLDDRLALCAQFGVETVPVLYRGPFDPALVDQYTDGPTVLCATDEAGSFTGREGIVITPVKERISEAMIPTSTNGRVIFKSVSADYLARKGGTDAH